jgi:hypothetical protein
VEAAALDKHSNISKQIEIYLRENREIKKYLRQIEEEPDTGGATIRGSRFKFTDPSKETAIGGISEPINNPEVTEAGRQSVALQSTGIGYNIARANITRDLKGLMGVNRKKVILRVIMGRPKKAIYRLEEAQILTINNRGAVTLGQHRYADRIGRKWENTSVRRDHLRSIGRVRHK